MNLEGIALTRLARELNNKLQGARIERVFQVDRYSFIMNVRGFGESFKLHIALHPDKPALFFDSNPPENPDTPTGLCMLWRKHLEEGKIATIEQVGFDRVILITIDTRGERNRIVSKQLYIELMGKNSNAILTEDGIVIDSAKRVGLNANRYRQIVPTATYLLPPTQDKLPLHTVCAEDIVQQQLPLQKALLTTIGGIGPQTAQEILARAGLPTDILAHTLDASDIAELTNALTAIRAAILDDAEPITVCTRDGALSLFAPYLATNIAADCTQYPDMLTALSATWSLDKYRGFTEKVALAGYVNHEIERTAKRIDGLTSDLCDANAAECYKIYGDTLLSYGFMITERSSNVELPDLYNDGEKITIPLDERYDAAYNAQLHYNRYNKLRRAQALIANQLADARALLQYLESISTAIFTAETKADINDICEELYDANIMTRPRSKKQKQPENKPHSYLSPSGLTILVGKNNKQNDILTFKIANANDLWFHTKDIPGSHVIMRLANNTPTNEDIEYAARLAAYYSKARASSKVPVDYTVRRQVKKPSGAAPGFVIYFEQTTVYVEPLATQDAN